MAWSVSGSFCSKMAIFLVFQIVHRVASSIIVSWSLGFRCAASLDTCCQPLNKSYRINQITSSPYGSSKLHCSSKIAMHEEMVLGYDSW
ncbi:hypothetical protein ACB092_11G173000 [Castanea dentata]